MPEEVQAPVANYRYTLSLPGIDEAGFFAEISGFSSETTVIEHTAADSLGEPLPQRFAGQVKWSNIVFKRGVDAKFELWNWRQQIINGEIDTCRKDVTVKVLDGAKQVVVIYAFIRAWPCKYSSPGLNSGGNEILVEEMELAHEGFRRAPLT